MKLKTKLVVSFLIITLLPIFMATVLICVLGRVHMSTLERNYGVEDATVTEWSNTATILSKVSERSFQEMQEMITSNPNQMDDATYLKKINDNLQENGAYLIVRKDKTISYVGMEDEDSANAVIAKLPPYGEGDIISDNGTYIGGNVQVLVKQYDFKFADGGKGSAFLVADVGKMLPEVRNFFLQVFIGIIIVLLLVASLLMYWIYNGIMHPLKSMQKAAKNIRDGDLDFELVAKTDDELGQLTTDLEDMRKRLKDNVEEKMQFDKENRELISNISHDLKTPVTAIKGYAEGILDGVADTPEKQQRYVRTIYNKAVEMDKLINELTLYSKIDTNRIPYNFKIIPAEAFFGDCAEDLELELHAKGAEFDYANYVEKDVKIIADPEQLGRVIHNIVNNSMKYMDKSPAKIHLRVKDVGDFIQVELEDNGKGIAQADLQRIFDRFYRTDASRNSTTGGSGIGLSIVKKIVKDHGGNIWATSKEQIGTVMHFVLRKYQEAVKDE